MAEIGKGRWTIIEMSSSESSSTDFESVWIHTISDEKRIACFSICCRNVSEEETCYKLMIGNAVVSRVSPTGFSYDFVWSPSVSRVGFLLEDHES